MSIWGCNSPGTYCQPAAAGFIYCRSLEWDLHSPSPIGFVYLEFSWTHALFVFSSIHPYLPVETVVLFFLVFTWGGALPPLSGGACHTLDSVGGLPLSKHTGGGGTTPAFSGQLVCLQFMWGSAPPPSQVELSSWQPLLQAFLSSRLLGGCATPAFSGRLVYLQFPWGSAPPPLSRAQGAPPSLLHVFFSFHLLLYYLCFFSGISLSRGLFWFVPGSTPWHLFAHLVVSQAG
jgi:hypothetical protein